MRSTARKYGMPTTPGAINGGFWVPDDKTPHQSPHVVISVDNLEEAIEGLTQLILRLYEISTLD